MNDIKKVKNKKLLGIIRDTIKVVESVETMQDIPYLKKIQGTKKGIYYRIKVGDYRIGITIENVRAVAFGAECGRETVTRKLTLVRV